MLKTIILKRKYADRTIRRRSSEMTARLSRRPGDQVHRGGVQRELVDALPLPLLLAPYENSTVVGAGGEDGAVARMSPGDGPDGAFVAFQCFG